VSPSEFKPLRCGSTTNVALRSERCGCQGELLVTLVFSRMPALLPLFPQRRQYASLLRQKESAFWSKRINAQQSQPRQL